MHEVHTTYSQVQSMVKEAKRQRRIKRALDQQVDDQLSKALLQDGLNELEDLEKEKLCLHEITSLL